jgi:hypothetical protein
VAKLIEDINTAVDRTPAPKKPVAPVKAPAKGVAKK